MIGLLVNNNLEALNSLSVESIGDYQIIQRCNLSEKEQKLVKDKDESMSITEIAKFEKSDLVIGSNTYGFSRFHTNPIPKIKCVLFTESHPIYLGASVEYEQLKDLYSRIGILSFSKFIQSNPVKEYIIKPPKHENQLLVDSSPFEFILIQLGLQRVERHPFESDNLNTLSNAELWEMYLLNERVDIYEYDSLLRRGD